METYGRVSAGSQTHAEQERETGGRFSAGRCAETHAEQENFRRVCIFGFYLTNEVLLFLSNSRLLMTTTKASSASTITIP